MRDGLDQLKQEVVIDLLRSWIDVYDEAQAAYDSFPGQTRTWIDNHGHRVNSLVPVVAFMQPDVRVLCRYLVESALESLSQETLSLANADEQQFAQAKSGTEVGGTEERLDALEGTMREIVAMRDEIVSLLGDLGAIARSRLEAASSPQPDARARQADD